MFASGRSHTRIWGVTRIPDSLRQGERILYQCTGTSTTCSRKTLDPNLTVHERSMGFILGQYDETGCKEQAIYYLSKKFTDYESKYSSLEKMCCALACVAKRLRQYMFYHTTWLIARLHLIKYIFEKPSLFGRIVR